MPFLRLAQDNTLADTLGGLSQSLAGALDPTRRLQAYQIQQRMWLEQEQLRQLQQQHAAQQGAISRYAHLVPAEALPEIANMIYQNAPQDQITKRVAQLSGRLVDDPSDAGLAKNLAFMHEIDPGYNYLTSGPPVAGPLTAKQADNWKVTQGAAAVGANKTAELGAQDTRHAAFVGRYINADTPEARQKNLATYIEEFGKPPDDGLTPPVTPIFQQIHDAEVLVRNQQMKYGDTMGPAQAKAELAKNLVDDPTGGHDASNRVILRAMGETPDTSTLAVVGDLTRAAAVKQRNQSELEKSAAIARGAQTAQGGTDPTKPVQTGPLPPIPGQPDAPVALDANGAPVPAPAPAPAPRSGRPFGGPDSDTTISGYRVQAWPRASGPIRGFMPGAQENAQKQSETFYKTLNDAYTAGGEPAAKLKDTIRQLKGLSDIAQTGGVYGQWTALKRDLARSLGVGDITDAQQAQTTMDNLLKTLIPELKSDYNLSRVAQPEIALLGKVTGSSDLTPGELGNILANLYTGTQLSQEMRRQSSRALGLSADQSPYDYPDYSQFENDALAQYSTIAQQNRVKFGAINDRLDARQPVPAPVQQPVPAPVQQPADNPNPTPVQTPRDYGNPVFNFLGHLFDGSGGGS